MEEMKKIIAVDFDGCLVENDYPEIGTPIERNIDRLKKEQATGARVILWTNRQGEYLSQAVAFCNDHGIVLDTVNANLPETIEAFGGDSRKIFADEYWDDRAVTVDIHSGESDWAAREIDLACQAEKESAEGTDEWDYGVACYESALRAYQSLIRDGHSGFSISVTKNILNRLIEGKCLTPIEDTPDIWGEVDFGKEGVSKSYQCSRMSSLFKEVAEDGTVTYSDVSRVYAMDIGTNIPYQSGFVTRLVDKIFPIEMPYYPSKERFKVIRDTFLVDEKNGDYDTVAYLYMVTPEGKKLELNRYFKWEDDKMVNIDKAEFDDRKNRRIVKK